MSWITAPFAWLLKALYELTGSYGRAAILFGVVVNLILLPFMAKSKKSMMRTSRLQPRIAELQRRHEGNQQKLNEEMAKLYREEKINPMGVCLPIVLQIPVFLALYWVLLASVELRGSGWILWIKDLAAPDPWFILPLIMMATMFIQVKLNPKPADPTHAKMMLIMPLVFSVMFFIFASGLVLYWLTNNILSIAQQWWVNKQIDEERANRKAAKEAKKKSS